MGSRISKYWCFWYFLIKRSYFDSSKFFVSWIKDDISCHRGTLFSLFWSWKNLEFWCQGKSHGKMRHSALICILQPQYTICVCDTHKYFSEESTHWNQTDSSTNDSFFFLLFPCPHLHAESFIPECLSSWSFADLSFLYTQKHPLYSCNAYLLANDSRKSVCACERERGRVRGKRGAVDRKSPIDAWMPSSYAQLLCMCKMIYAQTEHSRTTEWISSCTSRDLHTSSLIKRKFIALCEWVWCHWQCHVD